MKKTITILLVLLAVAFATPTHAEQKFGALSIDFPTELTTAANLAAPYMEGAEEYLEFCQGYQSEQVYPYITIVQRKLKPKVEFDLEKAMKQHMIDMGERMDKVEQDPSIRPFYVHEATNYQAFQGIVTGYTKGEAHALNAVMVQQGQTIWLIQILSTNNNKSGLEETQPMLDSIRLDSIRLGGNTVNNNEETRVYSPSEIPTFGVNTGGTIQEALQGTNFKGATNIELLGTDNLIAATGSAAQIWEAIKKLPAPKEGDDILVKEIKMRADGLELLGIPIQAIVIHFIWEKECACYRVIEVAGNFDPDKDSTPEMEALTKSFRKEIGTDPTPERTNENDLTGYVWEDERGTLAITRFGISSSIKLKIYNLEKEGDNQGQNEQQGYLQQVQAQEPRPAQSQKPKSGLTQRFSNLHGKWPFKLTPSPKDAQGILAKYGHNLKACRVYKGENDDYIIKVIESVYKPGTTYNPDLGLKTEMDIVVNDFQKGELPTYDKGNVDGFPAQRGTTTGYIKNIPVAVDVLSIQEGKTVWFVYIYADNSKGDGLTKSQQIIDTVRLN